MIMATESASQKAQYEALYQATVKEAAAGGSVLMGKMIAAARGELYSRELITRDLRDRDALAESAKQLRNWEVRLCKRYQEALEEAFVTPHLIKKAATLSVADVQFDQLELMDDVQVLTSVTIARTQQVAMLSAEASLAELNTLISSTLGLGVVRPERNPLRPEVYVHALKEVVEQTQVAAPVQLDWLGAMSVTLGQELRALYTTLAANLRRAGVTAANYAVTQTPSGVGIGRGVAQLSERAPGEAGATSVAAPTARSTAFPVNVQAVELAPSRLQGKSEVLLTLDKLRRLLSGELEPASGDNKMQAFAAQFAQQFEGRDGPAPVTQTDFDATVPAALEALTEMKQVDRVVQNLQERRAHDISANVSNEASADAVRSALRRHVTGVAQALSLEVVALMVENMAHDQRLLVPVQTLIRNLEPALLRLAMVDPRFFTDKEHPARILLQDVTHRSLAYANVEAPGFDGFMGQISKALNPLIRAQIEDAEPFEDAHRQLREVWLSFEKEKERSREQAVIALQHAEQRNLLAEKIARDIDSHPDASQVPAVVIDFLCGPWAQVVAQARIMGGVGSKAADKYQSLISAMLWSAHPDLASRNVAKLTKLVPLLISTLRDGLETIRYPATRTSAFLEALMGLHQLAFRSASRGSEPAEPSVPRMDPVRPAPQRNSRVADGDPWVDPEEARTSNFVDIGADTHLDSPDAAEVPVGSVLAGDANLDDLPLGSWVELQIEDQWVRTQLTWASPHGTLFLFTSAFGTTQSMTRRSRDRLVESGKLRVISGQPVVESALDAVAQVAMRNSVDTTL
jgi:hypothetical protein